MLTSPDAVSVPKKLQVFDVQNNLYMMLLSPCAHFGWTVYSITTGWDIFVSHCNLVPGDVVSFHRSREKDPYDKAYKYVLAKKSDKPGIISQFKAKDYAKSEPLRPGSSACDAYGTTVLLDPIISSVALPNEISILDIDKRKYNSSFGIRLVRFKSSPGQDMQYAMSLPYRNFARILAFEDDGSYIHVAYVWNEISPLSTYGRNPVKKYKTLDNPPNVYIYLRETHRRFIRDLILSVVCIHNDGKSLGGFSIQNLTVVDDPKKKGDRMIVFWGVMFYKRNGERMKADFSSIAKVVKAIVPTWKSDHIFLIKDLLKKLEGYSSQEDNILILKHLATMSAEEKLSFIRNIAEKKPPAHYEYYPDYVQALKDMEENTGWTEKYKTNLGTGPVYDCFNFSRRGYKDGYPYKPYEENESIFNFCRNEGTHLKQWMDMHNRQRVDRQNRFLRHNRHTRHHKALEYPEVTTDQVVATILCDFEKKLVEFQKLLHKKKILEKF